MQKAFIAAQTRWMEFKSNRQDEGAGLTEYLLLVGLIAIGAIVVVGLFGDEIERLFTDSDKKLEGVKP